MPVLLVAVALTAIVSCGRQQPTRQTLDSATRSRVTTALKVAQRRWGVVCDGQVAVSRATISSAARAAYRYPAGRGEDPGAYYDCRILIGGGGHISSETLQCSILHEVGHLAGWRARRGEEFVRPDGSVDRFHAGGRRSIMHPTLTRVFPACRPT